MKSRRVPLVQQMEAAECGVACLAMVLRCYGYAGPLEELREACGTSRDGNTALDLLKGARQLGLSGRGLKVPLHRLKELQLPLILHWEGNHFVVLERVTRGALVVVDPTSGRQRVPLAEAERQFSGVALELTPGTGFARRKPRSPSVERYVAILRNQPRAIGFVLLTIVTQQLLAVCFPAVTQLLVDHVVVQNRPRWLPAVLGVLAFSCFAQVLLERLRGVSQARLRSALGMVPTLELGRCLLRLPLPFLDSRSHGDLLERVHQQSEVQALIIRTSQAAFDVVFVALLVGLMLSYDVGLGLLSLSLTTLRLLLIRRVRKSLSERTSAELAASGREQGALAEALAVPEMTRGLGIQRAVCARFAQRSSQRIAWRIGSARLELGLTRALSVFGTLMQGSVLWFGGRSVIAGEMTVGVFAGFIAVQAMTELPLASLMSVHEGWVKIRGTLERSDDLMALKRPVRGRRAAQGRIRGAIEARALSFRFGNHGPWILRNVNLLIRPGEHVAFVGSSGGGKSTLARLLVGLLDPTSGQVLWDGVDLRELDQEGLAAHLGVVLQEPAIFAGTLADVVRLRAPQAPLAAVRAALEVAQLLPLVARIPGGIEARLASGGRDISGGERQRLAIAQAVLKQPEVLVFDEATCSLDAATESRVLANVARLGATVINVAHRETAIAHATRVFTIAAGSVTEDYRPADSRRVRGHPTRQSVPSIHAVGEPLP